MISKEQIAHDLAIIYLQNRYGVSMRGNLCISDGTGTGSLETDHFPSASEPQYVKVSTGEKGLFGLERKQKIQSGNKTDSLFSEMLQDYCHAYSHFYKLLCERDSSSEN